MCVSSKGTKNVHFSATPLPRSNGISLCCGESTSFLILTFLLISIKMFQFGSNTAKVTIVSSQPFPYPLPIPRWSPFGVIAGAYPNSGKIGTLPVWCPLIEMHFSHFSYSATIFLPINTKIDKLCFTSHKKIFRLLEQKWEVFEKEPFAAKVSNLTRLSQKFLLSTTHGPVSHCWGLYYCLKLPHLANLGSFERHFEGPPPPTSLRFPLPALSLFASSL